MFTIRCARGNLLYLLEAQSVAKTVNQGQAAYQVDDKVVMVSETARSDEPGHHFELIEVLNSAGTKVDSISLPATPPGAQPDADQPANPTPDDMEGMEGMEEVEIPNDASQSHQSTRPAGSA